MRNQEIEELLNRVADGSGYGDPEARLNDDRKLQILLAREQSRAAGRLNTLTLGLVIVGIINVIAIALQVFWKR